MKKLFSVLPLFFLTGLHAFIYPTFEKTLPNGLKIIACEKPGSGFAEVEVWYRVGSKDEKPGIRGMAHMFEHMMFRGTKNVSGEQLMHKFDSAGAQWNAYTTFDRTVYHEYLPVSAVGMALMLEADRMANLQVTQHVLDTEREVVGEELRNGQSNWYQRMYEQRYPLLYPSGHPYEVDVIGNLSEITAFTAEQCMDFYGKYYSPNNAFVVIVGDMSHEEIFRLAEKHFSAVTKQLPAFVAGACPDILNTHVKATDMNMDFPLQDYCFTFPQPETTHKDFFTWSLIHSILFADENSILNERLVKQEHSAFAIIGTSEAWSLYPCRAQVDVFMAPTPGNVKVKKAIREEIDKVIANGLPQEKVDDFISNMEATRTMNAYYAAGIADDLGMAEYYFHDFKRADTLVDDYKAVTQDDVKRVAGTYFSAERTDVINIKPL
jgi:zinc protease